MTKMGGGQSNLNRANSDDEEFGDCQPCFLFKSPLRLSNDPIGSPMPDTPVIDRRKRDEAISAYCTERRTNPIYSSKYFGLEKEVLQDPNAPKEESEFRAEVYEGKVSAFLS